MFIFCSGFGLHTDMKAIESALPHIGGSLVADKGGYLDLHSIWQRLSHDYNFVFPFPGMKFKLIDTMRMEWLMKGS